MKQQVPVLARSLTLLALLAGLTLASCGGGGGGDNQQDGGNPQTDAVWDQFNWDEASWS